MDTTNRNRRTKLTPARTRCWVVFGICFSIINVVMAQGLPINPAVKVELQSESLGESREIWISTPAEYDLTDKRYPVLYLMDARWHFNHTVGTAEFLHNVRQAPPMIVVGIVSYNRSKDMLPDSLSSEADRFGANVGGADKFLEFIDKEVGNYLDAHYRVADYRMLFGHSLGGLTVLHAFKTKPQSFDLYHALSPSILYLPDDYIKDWVDSLASDSHSAQALFISAGSEEQQLTDHIKGQLITPLTAKLPPIASLNVNVVAGNHSSMVQGATADSLNKHFSDWTLSAALQVHQNGGYPKLREHLADVHRRYPFDTYDVLNHKMFGVAEHTFLSKGVDPAMELLAHYINDFPAVVSPLIYEAQGQGYSLKGEHHKALEVIKEVYKRNPGSELAVEVLSQAGDNAGVDLPPNPLPSNELTRYVGTYAVEGNPALETFIRDGELWVRSRGPVASRLRRLGDGFYALGSERIHYQFIRDDRGKVTGLKRDSALGSTVATKNQVTP